MQSGYGVALRPKDTWGFPNRHVCRAEGLAGQQKTPFLHPSTARPPADIVVRPQPPLAGDSPITPRPTISPLIPRVFLPPSVALLGGFLASKTLQMLKISSPLGEPCYTHSDCEKRPTCPLMCSGILALLLSMPLTSRQNFLEFWSKTQPNTLRFRPRAIIASLYCSAHPTENELRLVQRPTAVLHPVPLRDERLTSCRL